MGALINDVFGNFFSFTASNAYINACFNPVIFNIGSDPKKRVKFAFRAISRVIQDCTLCVSVSDKSVFNKNASSVGKVYTAKDHKSNGEVCIAIFEQNVGQFNHGQTIPAFKLKVKEGK